MTTLYLIFSHDNPSQLVRLASAIRQLSPGAPIAIHHDPGKKILDPHAFSTLSQIYFVPDPIRGEWGDFSLVQQYLHAMRWCTDCIEFDWMCTLTGLSYPISPLVEFERRLDASCYDAYVRYFDAFDPGPYPKGRVPEGTAEKRYLFRYFKLPRFRYYHRFPSPLKRFLHSMRLRTNESSFFLKIISMPRGARTRLGIRRLRLPFESDFTLCGGRQIVNVNRRALDKIFSFLETHPNYEAYFRHSLIPDEGFFTSILANDPELRVRNDVLRYIKWPGGIGSASVSVILKNEVSTARASGAPFALKLDERVDKGALDLIDSLLGINHPVNYR
jgi:hypothetical protein